MALDAGRPPNGEASVGVPAGQRFSAACDGRRRARGVESRRGGGDRSAGRPAICSADLGRPGPGDGSRRPDRVPRTVRPFGGASKRRGGRWNGAAPCGDPRPARARARGHRPGLRSASGSAAGPPTAETPATSVTGTKPGAARQHGHADCDTHDLGHGTQHHGDLGPGTRRAAGDGRRGRRRQHRLAGDGRHVLRRGRHGPALDRRREDVARPDLALPRHHEGLSPPMPVRHSRSGQTAAAPWVCGPPPTAAAPGRGPARSPRRWRATRGPDEDPRSRWPHRGAVRHRPGRRPRS